MKKYSNEASAFKEAAIFVNLVFLIAILIRVTTYKKMMI